MSYYDYVIGRQLTAGNPPFYAVIQAAMRRADTDNLGTLKAAFPGVWDELKARYGAPGGLLPGEAEAPDIAGWPEYHYTYSSRGPFTRIEHTSEDN